MNHKEKVILIVSFQIALIVGSFLALVFIESELLALGNSINSAGLNRFLTANLILELHSSEIFYAQSQLTSGVDSLRNNLDILKNGGNIGGVIIKPLPVQLLPYWDVVSKDFEILEKNVPEYQS